MPRTIVYPQSPAAAAAAAGGPPPLPPDEFGDKLVKYLPAEVVAFYVPIYALIPTAEDWARWLILAVAALGTLGHLLLRADPANPPRRYFFVLAVVAFLGWAIGTSTVGSDLLGMEEWLSKIVLLLVVFAVPLIDGLLTKYLP